MRNGVALALVAALGCDFSPRYQRPALPVPNSFGAAGGSIAAADRGWRTMFGDPRLQAIIALALANNRDLRVTALQIEVAQAEYRIQRADLLPIFGASVSSSVSNVPGAGLAGGANQATAGTSTTTGAGPGFSSTRIYRVGATAAWELDLFGRIRNLTEAALEQYLASIEALRAAHLALVGQVVTQYLAERGFAEQYAIAVRTEAATRATYDLMRRLFEAGQRSELDMRATEAQWRGARAEMARLSRAWSQARNALVQLVGAPLPADLPPPQPLASQRMIADLAPGVPSHVLLRRPDVLAAEHVLRAANANIGAARAAFFPDISLTGFGGLISTSLRSLFDSGQALWTFTPQITMPIFAGGRNVANLDAAHARRRIEIARYEQTIQVAFREVADALVARATYETQLVELVARVHAEQVRFDLSDQRYREGIASYLDVLDAQQDLYTAQQTLVQLRVARLTNLADLYRALGGGWREY